MLWSVGGGKQALLTIFSHKNTLELEVWFKFFNQKKTKTKCVQATIIFQMYFHVKLVHSFTLKIHRAKIRPSASPIMKIVETLWGVVALFFGDTQNLDCSQKFSDAMKA